MSKFLELSDTNPINEYEQVPFNHPLFIMYSSGTTGLPKCMVHSVGVSFICLTLVPKMFNVLYSKLISSIA